MDVEYKDKDQGMYSCRYILQGPHYYALIAHYKENKPRLDTFFSSFLIQKTKNTGIYNYVDSSLAFQSKTTFIPSDKLKNNDLVQSLLKKYKTLDVRLDDNEYDTSEKNRDIWEGIFENKTIQNDTTGESISVSYYQPPRYYYDKDSALYKRIVLGDKRLDDSANWIIKEKKIEHLANNLHTRFTIYQSKNSSRTLITKVFYRNGTTHTLMTESDTITPTTPFYKYFFDSFQPIYDREKEHFNAFQKKSTLFFSDYFNKDSIIQKRSIRFLSKIWVDKEDIANIEKAIATLSWKKDRKYMSKKTNWLLKLGDIASSDVTKYLKNSYHHAKDTTELQNAILKALLHQRTSFSFQTFKDIVANDPPVVGIYNNYRNNIITSKSDLAVSKEKYAKNYDELFGGLYDSLKLVKNMYPDLLPLINLDDYKNKVMDLTTTLLDSNVITGADYKIYFSKFFLEAKQELKKQLAMENKSNIDEASKSENNNYNYDNNIKPKGNKNLDMYAQLLLPYYDNSDKVHSFFTQLLMSNDKLLRLNTYITLIKNGKKVSDTILNSLAADDDYRYKLYQRLKKINKLSLFPDKYNSHILLAKSELLSSYNYNGSPDSLVFLSEKNANIGSKKGLVYFFKYKWKKDDYSWKIATVGLTPIDTKRYEFSTIMDDNSSSKVNIVDNEMDIPYYSEDVYLKPFSLTSFSNTSIKSNKPLEDQINKVLTQEMIRKYNNGRFFYQNNYAINSESIGF